MGKVCTRKRNHKEKTRFLQLFSFFIFNTERMVLDENTGEYRPRWGYKRANDANDEWIIEAKNNDGTLFLLGFLKYFKDPNIDPFAKKIKQKKEHIALQKKQERLNLRRGGRSDGAELKLPCKF
jgi:hypothetical protein